MDEQQHESFPDPHHGIHSRTVFGFWIYLLTDFILFAALFATYAVLKDNTFGGLTGRDLFILPYTLVQSLLMLLCSFTSGMGCAYAYRENKKGTLLFFGITALLGMAFLGMELGEFSRLIQDGHGWQRSAFLSSFFSLIGTHGVHIFFAILWTFVLLPPVFKQGITDAVLRRLTCLKMFWQFLNIVWVFIFTLVYLLGAELV